jgi:hypothetical protein
MGIIAMRQTNEFAAKTNGFVGVGSTAESGSAPCQFAVEESESRGVSKSVETITSNLCSSGSLRQYLSRVAETDPETIRDVLTTLAEVKLEDLSSSYNVDGLSLEMTLPGSVS